MRRTSTRSALLATLAVAAAAWWLWPSSCEKAASPSGGDFATLANRIWIDHMPTNERDKIDIFIMLDDPAVGAFSQTSTYEGDWTSFEWSLSKGLVLNMLQANAEHRVSPKVTKGQCAPFDYCLKLKGAPRGSKTYVSMEDWVVNSPSELNARIIFSELLSEAK